MPQPNNAEVHRQLDDHRGTPEVMSWQLEENMKELQAQTELASLIDKANEIGLGKSSKG